MKMFFLFLEKNTCVNPGFLACVVGCSCSEDYLRLLMLTHVVAKYKNPILNR